MINLETNNEYKLIVNILRHGKTELNERHCYIGITDESLSKNGRNEIMEKALTGMYTPVDKVFASPFKRAVESADIMYPDIVKIIINNFSEMDFGSFEGKNFDELKDNKHYRKWIDEARGASAEEISHEYGDLGEPGADGIVLPENMQSFYERILNGLNEVLLMSLDAGEVSIVAHGGTIMAIASSLSGEDYYSYMLSCGDGLKTEVVYRVNDNGNIEISRFSVIDRICP